MSEFTEAVRDQALGGWKKMGSFADWWSKRNQGRSVGERTGTGCLAFLVLGFVSFLLPLLIWIFVMVAIGAYALLMTALWGIGAAVDGVVIYGRKRQS